MIKSLITFGTALILISCGQDKPKIDYVQGLDTTSVVDDRFRDTTKLLVSELPVKFDSTDILLFAVELVDLEERRGYSGSSGYSDMALGYFDEDYLSGNYINIVFKTPDGQERKLTDTRVRIRRVSFLREILKNTGSGYFLYSVYDRDSNGDNELNHSDLEALYISKVDGTDFKKVTRELHEFYDWSSIKGSNLIYFRTLEDKNKDGELNNKDKFHYYYINFSTGQYSVEEFNPVKIFE
jgi:hypothetical protein